MLAVIITSHANAAGEGAISNMYCKLMQNSIV
jgi:hypothetical protein